MTVSERKLQILLNINQQTVANLIDELARVTVENDELKSKAVESSPKSPPPHKK